MSRIHEALKKAQQERGSSTVPEITSAPEEATPVIPEWQAATTAGTAPQISHPEPVAALPTGYLRFEDVQANCMHPEWRPDPGRDVFFNPSLNPSAAEQFRTLRSRLYQLRDNLTLRTVLVTSSEAGEGKSFVVSNLAEAIVRHPDRRVLMIDAD